MKYTHEIIDKHGGALLPECTSGAYSGNKIPRVYRPLYGKKAPSRGPTPYTRFYIPLLREKIIIGHFITAIFKSQNSAYFSTKLILICSQSAEKWKRFRMMRFRTDVIKSKKQCNLWINHTAKCQSACREITSDFKMDVIKRENLMNVIS